MLATEYNRIIISKEPIPNKALSGHVIRTENVDDEGSCRLKCYLEPDCVSINVGPADEGRHTCELNNATDESALQSALDIRLDYTHNAIEVRNTGKFSNITFNFLRRKQLKNHLHTSVYVFASRPLFKYTVLGWLVGWLVSGWVVYQLVCCHN